ncbi:hypothetical protein [Saprospira grandis]|uniref:hypothetical protein n=1 Tax=Saprospira grandis TaxID=1008 RepID=UPI0022DCE5BD|nr:hypothetical protein [Saprospira grandis]WBM75222.1 hypothetical protein OP864_03050 [Saprospira grandis]
MKLHPKKMMKWALFLGLGLFSLQTAYAQDAAADNNCTTWESYPKGRKAARQQHVIYRDRFNQQNYKDAYPIWEELFQHVKAPKGAETRHFEDGAVMAYYFAGQEADAEKKKEWFEKGDALYEQNAACNGEDALVRAYQAYYLYANQAPMMQTIKAYERSLDLGKDKAPAMIMTPLATLTVYAFRSNVEGIDAEYMRKLYASLEELAKKNPKDDYKKAWTEVDAQFEPIKDAIFGCAYYTKIWRPKFEADPRNQAQNTEILTVIGKKCGGEDEFYLEVRKAFEEVADSIAAANFDKILNNDTTTAYTKILMYRSKGAREESQELKDKAWEFYPAAIDEEGWVSNEVKADLAYRYADRLFRAGSFGSARSYCRKASKFRPNWGEPYLLVGIMYASSGGRCSAKGTGWDAQICVWPAIDEWVKAKSVDPSVAAKANKYIGQYSAFMPTKTEIFQRQLKEGASIKVPCWIQQTTTIRGR